MCCPLTLFKKQTGKGAIWYARFWDEMSGKYALKRSTGILAEGKKERRREAERKAWKMLSGISFGQKRSDQLLASFWKPDSPYAKECTLIRKRPLSAYYVLQNAANVQRRRHKRNRQQNRDAHICFRGS